MRTRVDPTDEFLDAGPPESPPPSSSNSLQIPLLIAGALVLAGLLIGVAILFAAIINSGAEVGPGDSPSLAPEESPSPANHSTHYLPERVASCPHSAAPTADQIDNLPGIEVLYSGARLSHSCVVPSGVAQGVRVSYHEFETVERMNAVYLDALETGGHVNHSDISCEAAIHSGWGPYNFEDGRSGQAACLSDGKSLWIVWTEESTNVIGTAYAGNLSLSMRAPFSEFWKSEAGPVP